MKAPRRRSALVVRSIETPSGERCVDLFRDAQGRFGFEEYRRDWEDPAGWRPAGGYAEARFENEAAALEAATGAVGWLADALTDRADG